MLRLELDELLQEVKVHDARIIGIQIPAGLRQSAREISSFFESRGYDVIFSGDPSYGACDIADHEMAAAGADLLIHFGHSRMLDKFEIPVIYWDVKDDISIKEVLSSNISKIRSLGDKVGLATTVQHVHKLGEAAEFLRAEGMVVQIGGPGSRASYPGQVLGCSFEAIEDLDVDFYVYIGTGYFHPIGISLSTDKEVLYCDPYLGTCVSIDDERNKILKKRYAMMSKARDKRDFAILISTKRGQNRYEQALYIKKLLKKNGKSCQLIFAEEINKYLVQDFDFEAYIVAACPRIAIDDAPLFDKPVLTVAETEIMFNNNDYVFDEIRKI